MDMTCKAVTCHPTCSKDNCKITCDDGDATGLCQPICTGRGCLIDVHSTAVEGGCNGGSCVVRLSKNTGGWLSCTGGNCTLTCAIGTDCRYQGSCPNCTGPLYVDDPFASSGEPIIAQMLDRDKAFRYIYGLLAVFALLFI